jgi:hypothetical protein
MSAAIYISMLGAISAITVSLIGAWFANRNNLILQTRKLKEDHYVSYIEALHNLASNNEIKEIVQKYVFVRDKLFLIASEDVIKKMLFYEEEGRLTDLHDFYLTELIKAIRKDLRIKDKDFPVIYLKK